MVIQKPTKQEMNLENKSERRFTYRSGDRLQIRRDSYFRDRGKVAEMWDICCGKCGAKILLYQKDGRGKLHRTYLNRIFDPPFYKNLQDDPSLNTKTMPPLTCPKCNELVGYPMLHREGRLAYFLRSGAWSKNKSEIRDD